MTRFTFPLCSHLPHATSPTPISSTTTIIDLEHVSFSSMWRLRHHLQEASRLSTANYPETLHSIAIVNSPSFFPTIWNWIKVGRRWICVFLPLIFVHLRAGSTKAPASKFVSSRKTQGDHCPRLSTCTICPPLTVDNWNGNLKMNHT